MDPERPIEKMLRAWADKRRNDAGPPFELHPVTRRLLQGEVMRHNLRREPGRSPSWQWFINFAPRLGLAAGLIVIAAVCVFTLPMMHRKSEMSLAKNQPSPSAPQSQAVPASPAELSRTDTDKATQERANQPVLAKAQKDKGAKQATTVAAAPPAPAESPSLLSKKLEAADASTAERLAGTAPGGAEPVARPEVGVITQKELSSRYGLSRTRSSARPTSAAEEKAPAQAATQVGLTTNDALAGSVTGGQYAFRRVARAGARPVDDNLGQQASFGSPSASRSLVAPGALQGAPTAPSASRRIVLADRQVAGLVLHSFKVEQTGRELRIIDRDGSIYNGSLQSAAPLAAPAALSRQQTGSIADSANRTRALKVDSSLSASQVSGPVPFTVSGTNRTLGQELVFTGSIQGLGPGSGPVSFLYTGNGIAVMAPTNTVVPAGARILGKVVVGGQQTIQIEAVQQGP